MFNIDETERLIYDARIEKNMNQTEFADRLCGIKTVSSITLFFHKELPQRICKIRGTIFMKLFEKFYLFKNTATDAGKTPQNGNSGEIPYRTEVDSWLAFRRLL